MKYKNPPVSKNIICFEMYINWEEPIILCEGVFDAMTIKRNAIPLLGKVISKELMLALLDKKVKEAYIVLDGDAKVDSLRLSRDLESYGIQTKMVKMDKDDPNELGYNKISEKIDNTNKLTFNDIIKSKLEGSGFEKRNKSY